ncbi:MAG: hypothetical protein ACT4QG_10785 [Sporichthyaceae bacterium]
MNDQLRALGFKALAAALVAGGLACVLLGYLGVRRNDDIVLQLPYLASGGIGGLALIALGAVVLLLEQMREQTRRAAAVTESLEEWKESAMTELRAFLQNTTLELEVVAPTNGRAPVDALNS